METFVMTEVRLFVGVYADVEPGLPGDSLEPADAPQVALKDVVGVMGPGKFADIDLLPLLGEAEKEMLRELVLEEYADPSPKPAVCHTLPWARETPP